MISSAQLHSLLDIIYWKTSNTESEHSIKSNDAKCLLSESPPSLHICTPMCHLSKIL